MLSLYIQLNCDNISLTGICYVHWHWLVIYQIIQLFELKWNESIRETIIVIYTLKYVPTIIKYDKFNWIL